MYELEYVRKRKRRKLVAIAAGVSSVVVSTFTIVAFLGRFVGTFTVSLDTGDVELALSESSSFKNKSSFLRVDTLPAYQETTYKSLPFDELDDENKPYLSIESAVNYDEDETIASINFFKYTFFVKNVGSKTAGYNMKVKISENKADKDGTSLEDTMRVMIYETDASDPNNELLISNKVYAAPSAIAHEHEDGKYDYREPISIAEDKASSQEDFPGYAEVFASANEITTIPVTNFEKDDLRRYTIVTWLEGEDPQSDHRKLAPKGAKLKLGVEINAYENK